MLVHNYKSFGDMFIRFTNITNSLNALGRKYTNSDLIRKNVRSLPQSQKAKMTTIQEAKDLSKLPLDELLESLMTHEIIMSEYDEEHKIRKNITLESSVIEDKNEEEDKESEDKNIALTTKKFKSFLRKK